METKDILETLARGEDLGQEAAEAGFERLMAGELSPAQAGAFLMGLRAKGETPDELAAGVRAAIAKARLVPGLSGPRMDTCGTGGDCQNSFNCSTTVALYMADMGHKVVKHGNRAVSSSCGSADIVEDLGLPMGLGHEEAAEELGRRNFVFLFAPGYHPAFAHVMPVRKELGIRTLFNLLGPLLNPARPTHQLVGAPSEAFAEIMARTLALTGVERAAVVHGAGGFDELTTFGENTAFMVVDGTVERTIVDPKALGFAAHSPEAVRVGDRADALATVKEVLSGRGTEAMRDMAALNLAMALHVLTGEALDECAKTAREKLAHGVDSGLLNA